MEMGKWRISRKINAFNHNKMKKLIIILLVLIFVLISFLPMGENGSSLLQRCEFRFNEATGGGYDVCRWIWDKDIRAPSF